MPDLPAILNAIHANPDQQCHWLALAKWYQDNRQDDEAAIIRAFWTTLQDDVVGGRGLEEVLEQVRRHRRLMGRRAREAEEGRAS
jgi:uncharacterized protein (TIGR02996 family)